VTSPRLVLWDVDLTLVHAGTLGRELYAAAFREATGRPMRFRAEVAGRLDPDIYRDTLAAHHLDEAVHPFQAFTEALARAYEAHAAELQRRGRALPGAAEALAALAGVPGLVQTVLTGNVPAVARAKLAAFGLDRYLDLEAGAYGRDGPVRSDLVRVAQHRAGSGRGAAFDRANTVLVGDTPHDVLAGRVGGARTVAVASGSSSAEELRSAGADVVLASLEDTAAVVRVLTCDRP
jgi:phosphoglycolate phosphatase